MAVFYINYVLISLRFGCSSVADWSLYKSVNIQALPTFHKLSYMTLSGLEESDEYALKILEETQSMACFHGKKSFGN